jgi:hypothetical protein
MEANGIAVRNSTIALRSQLSGQGFHTVSKGLPRVCAPPRLNFFTVRDESVAPAILSPVIWLAFALSAEFPPRSAVASDNIAESSMQVNIELPEDIARAMIADGQDLTRAAEQSIALEGYRSGRLSEEQVRRLLGFESRLQVHSFLKAHQVYLTYSDKDLDRDLETAGKFSSRWLSSQTSRRSTI